MKIAKHLQKYKLKGDLRLMFCTPEERKVVEASIARRSKAAKEAWARRKANG